jgi:serine/threonine protein phosphatase PrpC
MEVYGKSMTGSSLVNADAFWIAPDGSTVAVADGASGSLDKAAASRHCIEAAGTFSFAQSSFSPEEYLRGRILDANRRLTEKSQADGQLSFSTLTIAVVESDRVTVACAGDTPALLFRGAQVERLASSPRRYDEVVRRGYVTPQHALEAVKALPGPMQSAFEIFLPEVIPVFSEAARAMQSQDIFAICTDGLLDWVFCEELAKIFAEKYPLRDRVETIMSTMVARSRNCRRDDATLLAVQF